MSRAERTTFFIVIAARHIECAVYAARQWRQHTRFEFDGGLPALLQGLDSCAAFFSQHASTDGGSLRVLVADVWLAEAPVVWSQILRHDEQALAFARAQLDALGFSLQDDDLLRLDDAPYGQPRLAVAYPAVLIAALARLAGQIDASLQSLLPLGVAAWETLASRDVLAVRDEGMVLLLQGQGPVQDLSCRRVDGDGAEELAALWRRLQLRDARLAALDTLPQLDLTRNTDPSGEAPSAALQLAAAAVVSPLDAIASSRGRSPALRALAAAVVLLTLAALGGAMHAVQRWKQPAVAAELPVQQRSGGKPQPLTAQEAARVGSVNAAVRALNQPIMGLLRALEPPPGLQVALLGLDLKEGAGGKGPRMRITGLARTPADMSRYLRFIASQPAFAGVYLTGHEIVEERPRPYRFTLEASWVE